MKKSKKIVSTLLIASMIASLASCSKDEDEVTIDDYIAMYDSVTQENEELYDEIDSLKMELSAYGVEMTEDDIEEPYELLDTGEDRVYNTFNDYLIIKGKLDWEYTEDIGNSSSIKLNDVFELRPSNSWYSQVTSGKTSVYNDANITGSFALCDYLDSTDAVFLLSDYVRPYLEDIGGKKITSTYIYADGANCGVLTRSILTVNKKVTTDTEMKLREDYIYNGDKVLLDAQAEEAARIEAERKKAEKEAKKAQKKAEKEAKKRGETVAPTATEEAQSLGALIGDSTPAPTNEGGLGGLGDSISTDGTGLSADGTTSSPSPSLEPGEPTPEPEFKKVTVHETEKQKKEYVYYVGAVNMNNQLLEMKFIFENDDNASMKEELVTQLIKSISCNGSSVTLGNK